MVTVAGFLREQKVLRLTTVGPDGTPHTVPVWYIYSGKKVYVGTNSRTVKARNVLKNRRVAFCVDVGVNSPDIYGVMGRGRGRLIRGRGEVGRIATRILLRYFKSMDDGSARELLEDTDLIIEITPERISRWSY